MSHRVVIADKCHHPSADVVLTDWTEDAVNGELWKSPVKVYADSVETIREFLSAVEPFWDYYSEVWGWYVGDGDNWERVGGEHMGRDELLRSINESSELPADRFVTAKVSLDIRPNTITDYVSRLRSGERFGVARYGDGEWGAVLGKIQRTMYGDVVTRELADAIANTLKHPKPYFYASCTEPYTPDARQWIREHNVECRWAKKAVLEQASADGELLPFLEAVRDRKTVVVGMGHLRAISEILDVNHFVVDGPNCYPEIMNPTLCLSLIESFVQDADCILFACGLASVVFIHELWDRTDATLIDIGSLFDPYCGVESRRGHKRDSFRENVRKTLKSLNADASQNQQ